MIIAGIIVGSSGTLLTLMMAKAMNRSVSNVLFSNWAALGSGEAQAHRQPQGDGATGCGHSDGLRR